MTALLVSVRDVAEARTAARGGAGFIDLKEPREGALGGLPTATIRAIVDALRRDGVALPISATIGDMAATDVDAVLRQVDAVGACGVDYVKVGVPGDAASAGLARTLLRALSRAGRPVVPVFLADHGVDLDLIDHGAGLGFPAWMVDTADKARGSLFDVMPVADVHAFIAIARIHGALAGIAGALRLQHVHVIRRLAPDFAGFRSAVCAGDRSGVLDAGRLAALAESMDPAMSDRRPAVASSMG